MGKKSQRSKAQKKTGKIEDLPARQKGKNIKGGGTRWGTAFSTTGTR